MIVFVRDPRPGTAKTRLIPALGTHGAAIAQHRMTLRTLAAVRASGMDGQLHVSGDVAAAAALYPGSWVVRPQADGDLGHRLASAAAAVDGPVVVTGTDCPSLTADHLTAAFHCLQSADVSLGPAVDGGYYLLAMRRFHPELFRGISWSTDRVAAQTRAAAAAAGLTVAELPPLGDVDTPDDLPQLPPVYTPNRLAVTGATGAIGVRFLRRLLGDLPALCVTVIARSVPPRFRALLDGCPGRVTVIEQDLRSIRLQPSQRKLLTDSDGLWHLAARTALDDADDAATWATNDGGTAAVLDLLAASDAPGPLLHLSTAFVCGDRAGRVAESDLPDCGFRNAYEASKAKAERRVRSAMAAGLRGAILRPAVVVGDDADDGSPKAVDAVAAAVLAAERAGEPLVIRAPADAALNVVHADWLLAAMAAVAAGPHGDGRTFHLTARRPLRLAGVAAVVGPATPARELPPVSRRLDRALAPLRPYLSAGVDFDRTNLDAAAPGLVGLTECDPAVVLQHRRRQVAS